MELFLVDLGYEQQNMTEALRKRCLEMVREERRDKVQRLKNKKNQNTSLIAGMLLNVATGIYVQQKAGKTGGTEDYMFHSAGIIKLTIEELADLYDSQYDYELTIESNGKPVYQSRSDLFFNLSHSGNVVVCVIGSSPVGVDVEGNRTIYLNTAKRFFTEAEYNWVCEGTSEKQGAVSDKTERDEKQEELEVPTIEQKDRFLRIWTLKEAYSKLTGEGIAYGISQVEFLPDDDGYMQIAALDSNCAEKQQNQRIFNHMQIDECEYKKYRIAVMTMCGK